MKWWEAERVGQGDDTPWMWRSTQSGGGWQWYGSKVVPLERERREAYSLTDECTRSKTTTAERWVASGWAKKPQVWRWRRWD